MATAIADATAIPAAISRARRIPAAAADTAWVIASPDTDDQLVRHGGYGYDQLESWVRETLTSALLPDR